MYHSAKVFATGTADRKFCIFEKNRHCARNAAHPTSENGKLAALTSGRPAFRQHAKHAEGSDTSHVSHTRKDPERMAYKPQFRQKKKDHAAQRGRDTYGTATRISTSLSRRLSAFFGSTPDQGPKAAKFAVLIPDPGMFVNVQLVSRVMIAPHPKRPPVSACKPLCAILLAKASVYPLSPVKANVGRLCEKLKNAMKSGLEQRCGGSFAGFFSSAGVEGSQRTGKCMYIKARWNKRDFAGSTKPHCDRRREGPPFRRVSRCVRFFSERRVCTHFHS